MINLRYKEPRIYKGVTLLSYASEIDEGSLEQIINCAEFPNVKKIIITPDVHKGYTAPIGSVIITDNVLIPELLGNDIGCGISCQSLNINLEDIDNSESVLENFYKDLLKTIPINSRQKTKNQELNKYIDSILEMFSNTIQWKFFENSFITNELTTYFKEKFFNSFGTLGNGNHFIEICKDSENNLYSIVHTGSRSFGSLISSICNELCSQQKQNIEQFLNKINATLLTNNSISLTTKLIDLNTIIPNFSYYKEIANLLFIAQEFAKINRQLIQTIIYNLIHSDPIQQYLYGYVPDDYIDTQHNCFEIYDNKIYHFKGVSYFENAQYGIVAGSQTTGSYIVENLNKHNPISFCSHGAGRILSRTEARNTLDLETEKKKLDQIVKYNTFKNESSLEECTSVYKDLDKVIQLQSDFIKPVKKLTPLINIKG